MNKHFYIVLLTLLATSFFSNQSFAITKIAHFSYEKVVKTMPEYKKGFDKISTQERKMRNQLKSISQMIKKLNHEASSSVASEDLRIRREREINTLAKDYDIKQEEYRQEILTQQQKLDKQLTQKIMLVIKQIIKNRKLDYVFNIDRTQATIIVGKGTDITQNIINQLRRARE